MSVVPSAVDLVVLSNIIVDDVVLASGEERPGMLGGAATYAAAGMRLWSPRVGLISGVGEDFAAGPQEWFTRNQFDLQGVTARDPFTPRSWVRYEADGERTEVPQHGSEHFRRMESDASHIPAAYRNARGLYIFRTAEPAFWASLRDLPAPPAQTVLWEIAADAAEPELRPLVRRALASVQILSINRAEAFRLYGVSRPLDALHAALEDGAPVVVLRLGAQGSLATDGKRLLEIPAAPAQVVDVTGGGNAYSGGFLAGYCLAADGCDALESGGRYGAAAASFCIEQYGPPLDFDTQLIRAAAARAAALTLVDGALW